MRLLEIVFVGVLVFVPITSFADSLDMQNPTGGAFILTPNVGAIINSTVNNMGYSFHQGIMTLDNPDSLQLPSTSSAAPNSNMVFTSSMGANNVTSGAPPSNFSNSPSAYSFGNSTGISNPAPEPTANTSGY